MWGDSGFASQWDVPRIMFLKLFRLKNSLSLISLFPTEGKTYDSILTTCTQKDSSLNIYLDNTIRNILYTAVDLKELRRNDAS